MSSVALKCFCQGIAKPWHSVCFILWLCVWLVSAPGFAQTNVPDQVADENAADSYSEFEPNITLTNGEQLTRSNTGEQVQRDIREILHGDDFGKEKTIKGWRWIDTEDEEARQEKFPQWLIDFFDFLDEYGGSLKSLSTLLEVLLWACLIGLLLYLIVRYRASLQHFVLGVMQRSSEPELPASLMGVDLKKVQLPKDIPAEAMALWQQQKYRPALALLLQASLVKLLKEHRVKLYDSDTEAECCDRIDQQAPKSMSSYMRDLVVVWQTLAYAHRPPSETVFKKLCQGWPTVFEYHTRESTGETIDAE